jgi:hypothetical protein
LSPEELTTEGYRRRYGGDTVGVPSEPRCRFAQLASFLA